MEGFNPDFSRPRSEVGETQEYGRFHQHVGLLEDAGRVRAYLSALGAVKEGDVVVDVGAGSGIWGLAALKRGFRHAYLIEPSSKMCRYAAYAARRAGLQDRVTIFQSSLEALDLGLLPTSFDLIITETISSLIFGFGSWDALPNLVSRLSADGAAIPRRGKLRCGLVRREFASRGPTRAGLRLLDITGIDLDLFQRTFRSGGNVYDKSDLLWAIHSGEIVLETIAHFDLKKDPCISLDERILTAPAASVYLGVICYFDIELVPDKPDTRLSSLDPSLTSWSPLYVPFSMPLRMEAGEELPIVLRLLPIDDPYPYAFRFYSADLPLSETLYW